MREAGSQPLGFANRPQQRGVQRTLHPLELVQVQPHEILDRRAGTCGEVDDASDLALVELPWES